MIWIEDIYFVGKVLAVVREREANKASQRSHKARFPTPAFYFFGFVLNALAVAFGAIGLSGDSDNPTLIALVSLSILGLGIAIYSATLKPMEANKQKRKLLVAVSAGFGFVLLASQGLNLLMNPSLFA